MVSKNELLKDLKNGLRFEEEAAGKYSYFLKNLGWKRAIKQQYWNNVRDGLSTIKKETEKHEQMIKDMVKYIEGLNKNDF